MEISDDVIARATAGDMQAFEMIFRTYASMVFNVSLRMLRRREDAEDVSQEVFLTIHKRLKDFQGRSSLKTWIYRITINLTLNKIRSGGSVAKNEIAFEEGLDAGDSNHSAQAMIAQDHQQTLLNKMLDQLSEDQKACFLLRHIEGLSYEEIASVLKINVNAVAARLLRARENIVAAKNEVCHGL